MLGTVGPFEEFVNQLLCHYSTLQQIDHQLFIEIISGKRKARGDQEEEK